ncbi:MAG TPA: CdaR family protein [Candidatus Polarisedimenticolia bacterium]|nr:CdaR family protein [Candidatus Polarisedimenticolia bacterium]
MRPQVWLRSDPSLKIASIVLAVFVWLYVRTEHRPVQAVSVPLQVQGLPSGLSIAGKTLDHVTVRVRGTPGELREVDPDRFRAVVALDDAQPGEHSVPLPPEVVRAPLGLEVISVDPASITFTIERRMSRDVPVIPRFRGEPAPPYAASGYTVSPSHVTVEGPERVVRQVEHAVTDEVDLSGRTGSFEAVVGVQPDRGGVRVLLEGAAVVKVTLLPKEPRP